MCHVYVRYDSLVGVCFSDQEYPISAAHGLLTNLLDEFTANVPKSKWHDELAVPEFKFVIERYLEIYQNPEPPTPFTKMRYNFVETRIMQYDSMEELLNRGEKLDNLIERTTKLTDSSKILHNSTKKINPCSTSWR